MTFGYGKPEIEYPTSWEYKIIGSNVDKMLKAIEEVIIGLDYEVTPSNVNRKGTYFSLNIKVIVPSEVLRDIIFQKFSSHADIRMVI